MRKITTKSGTTYLFDNGMWKRNDERWLSTWSNYCVTNEVDSWEMLHDGLHTMPIQVGLRMYTSCMDSWWLSTPIVSIEEVEE